MNESKTAKLSNRLKSSRLHRRALQLKNEAEQIEDGTREKHDKYYEAYLSQREAALTIQDQYDLEPERSMMFLMAIEFHVFSLRDISECEDLVSIALKGNPDDKNLKELQKYRALILKRQGIRVPKDRSKSVDELRGLIFESLENPTPERMNKIFDVFGEVAVYVGTLEKRVEFLERVRNCYREKLRRAESERTA